MTRQTKEGPVANTPTPASRFRPHDIPTRPGKPSRTHRSGRKHRPGQGHTAPTCVSTHRTAPRPNQPGGQCGCSYSPMKHASHSVAEHTLQEQLWFESVPPDAHITFARCCVSWLCHCITRASNPWHTFLILKINAPAKVQGMEVVRLYQRMKPSYLKYSLFRGHRRLQDLGRRWDSGSERQAQR